MATFRVVDQPHGSTSIGAELQSAFTDPSWTSFRGAVAFAKTSGVRHIAAPLHEFAGRATTSTRLSIGISSRGTSLEGAQDLWRLLDKRGCLYIYHEGTGLPASFHPKVFLFENEDRALVISGSNNLTEGGLFFNHEFSTIVDLKPASDPSDASYLAALKAVLDRWQNVGPTCVEVNPRVLKLLYDRGDLPSEESMTIARRTQDAVRATTGGTSAQAGSPFGSSDVTKAPAPSAYPPGLPKPPIVPVSAVRPSIVQVSSNFVSGGAIGSNGSGLNTPGNATQLLGFPPSKKLYMEVRPHQNGEFFLSYRAIVEDPPFFGYPFTGWGTPKTSTAKPYPMATPDPVVDIVIFDTAGEKLHEKLAHPLNLVDYELKHEIRATLPDGLHRHVPAMSVLIMTKDPNPWTDYRLEFHPPGSSGSAEANRYLTSSLPSGGAPVARRYGWA